MVYAPSALSVPSHDGRAHRSLRAGTLCVALVGCSSPVTATDAGSDLANPPVDALSYDVYVPWDGAFGNGDGGMPTDVLGMDASVPDVVLPPGFFPAPSPPFDRGVSTPLTVQVSVSGEALGEYGYPFTLSPSATQVVFVDGWALTFDRYIVSLDHVRINQPGVDPTMQSSVGGLVAQRDGPWLVDVHQHGVLVGAGGAPESAIPLFVFTGPTAGGSFDPTVRYAFSFETVPATSNSHNVNLSIADSSAVAAMIAHGWTRFFEGTAIYQGTAPPMGSPLAHYPTSVHFTFGSSDPAGYINCENPDLAPAAAMDIPRGVQPSATVATRAQITLHTDHFFWDETDIEGTPLHFDPIAARAEPSGTVTLGDLVGDNPTALTDTTGALVPNRVLGTLESAMMDAHPPPSYLIRPGGSAVIRDYRDFVIYNARGQGHLNSNGLCFVQPTAPITY